MESDELATLRGFASGEIPPSEFRDRLYNNPGFESVLGHDPLLTPGNYVRGSAYLFLLECDFDDPGDVLSAHGAVCDFLDRNGHEYKRTGEYEDFYNLVLEASPPWLSADPKYVRDSILPGADGRTGAELLAWLTDQLRARCRNPKQSAPPSHSRSGDRAQAPRFRIVAATLCYARCSC